MVPLKVFELATPDINRFMREVMLGKTACVARTGPRGKAVVEGGVGTATRTMGLLGGILSYAVSEGIIPANPCRGVRRPADDRRDARLGPDQYRRLGQALRDAEAVGENWRAIAAIRLLALTGCRRGEVEKLRWSGVDRDRRCLRLAETEEGSSIRPAPAATLALLARPPREPGNPYVLPGSENGKPFQGLPKAWERIVRHAGVGHITPHILRHSHASVANDLGYTEATVSALQGRPTRSVTGAYIHHIDSALVAVAGRVGAEIMAMMGDRGRCGTGPAARTRWRGEGEASGKSGPGNGIEIVAPGAAPGCQAGRQSDGASGAGGCPRRPAGFPGARGTRPAVAIAAGQARPVLSTVRQQPDALGPLPARGAGQEGWVGRRPGVVPPARVLAQWPPTFAETL